MRRSSPGPPCAEALGKERRRCSQELPLDTPLPLKPPRPPPHPGPAGERPCSLMSHARPFTVCSLLSPQVSSVSSPPPCPALTPSQYLPFPQRSPPTPGDAVVLSHTLLPLSLAPDFLPCLLGYFLGLLPVCPITVHTSRGRYLDCCDGACRGCTAL